MNGLEVNLLLGSGHKVPHTCFGVFSPIGFNIDEFMVEDFLVESGEKGEDEEFLAFDEVVGVCKVEGPGPGARMGEHPQVISCGHKSQSS